MPDPFVGSRLKKRRSELGLSLRELAARTGVTASFLSQVERGVASPSLHSLNRIAEALNLPLMYFMDDGQARSRVVRSGRGPRLDLRDSHVAYEMLTTDLSGRFEAVMGRLEPGPQNITRPLPVDTEEFIIVLEGALCVDLAEGEFVLDCGDSIYFKGRDLRGISCASDHPARWISVITPPVF